MAKGKITVANVIGIVFGIAVIFFVQKMFFAPSPELDMRTGIVAEVNKLCPMMVDEETQLDSVNMIGENILQYNYSLVNMMATSVDTIEMRDQLTPVLIEEVKRSPELKTLRDHHMTMNYLYKDRNGKHLIAVQVSPDDYK